MEQLTVCTGQGSDEIFGGYSIFLADFLREPDETFPNPALPDSIRNNQFLKAEAAVKMAYPTGLNTTSPLVRRVLNNTITPAQMVAAFPHLPFKPSLVPISHEKQNHDPPDAQLTYPETIEPIILSKMETQWHPLHTAQYLFCKAHLENLLLSNLGDRGEMAHSIEGRTPFLDHRLTEYANNLPPSLKIRPKKTKEAGEKMEFVEKYVLREAARPFVTDEIYEKRKHPYSAPLQYPIGGPLHTLMKKLITEENVNALGFLDWKAKRLDGKTLGEMADLAFGRKDKALFNLVICVAQWVVLGQRFGVTATEVVAHGLKD
jgi:asparagine synthase (glutamine-hydrolysing)